MNYTSLYPVVHDLTEAEYNGCCSMTFAPPGCFSLHDLVNPATLFDMHEEHSDQNPARKSPLETRQRSEYPVFAQPQHYLHSLLDDDRNDNVPILRHPRASFEDTYVLTRQLYKGKISAVWECVQKETGARFVAKIISKRNLSQRDEDTVYQEIAILAEIKGESPHLSNMIEVFDEDTRFYIIMDYAEGGDILTTLVHKRKLSEMEAKMLAKSLLQGLVSLHLRRICHRNLKPENIILKSEREMSTGVITDFGMAARVLRDADGDSLNLTERCGTAMFMAPEVIAQIPYDTQADMWSFGVLIFLVLTGVHPFEDTHRQALYLKICKNEYSFHPEEWSGVSKNAKRFVANLLHTDPEVRMTADECLLHPWLAELLPSILPPDPMDSLPVLETEFPQAAKSPVKGQGSKLRCAWRVVRKRRGSTDEPENMDDWKSTSSKTTSLLSSNIA